MDSDPSDELSFTLNGRGVSLSSDFMCEWGSNLGSLLENFAWKHSSSSSSARFLFEKASSFISYRPKKSSSPYDKSFAPITSWPKLRLFLIVSLDVSNLDVSENYMIGLGLYSCSIIKSFRLMLVYDNESFANELF